MVWICSMIQSIKLIQSQAVLVRLGWNWTFCSIINRLVEVLSYPRVKQMHFCYWQTIERTIGLLEKEITSQRRTLNSNREEENEQLEQGKAGRKLLRISWRTIFLHMKISIRPRKSARSLESDKKKLHLSANCLVLLMYRYPKILNTYIGPNHV